MNSISQNVRYLPHQINTREYAVKLYRNGNSINYVCRKYHISKSSLMRWNKKYDGTIESLVDKSHKPKSPHPNSHTDLEIKWIQDYMRRTPNMTYLELWYKLFRQKGYKRHPMSLYRVMRKLGFKYFVKIKGTSKYTPKKYDTPAELGVKWQIDVKYVPTKCLTSSIIEDTKLYQYTCIDEASRKRYLYWYDEQSPYSTVDFVKRCIDFYGYKTKEIQTDNGQEFTYNREKIQAIHPLDALCNELNIVHHKIRPRTPRHNGKVERSHRSDNERFYSSHSFYSLEDLRKQGYEYLKRSNNIPMQVLGFKTPNEMNSILSIC